MNETGLDPTKPNLSHIIQGSGRTDLPAYHVERVKEYLFFVPRLVNGIGVATGRASFPAGIQIAVHRNGGVASVKVMGPIVHSQPGPDGKEDVQPPGYVVTRTVAKSDLDARVNREYPGATIKSLALQYRLPDDNLSSVVVPSQLYSVSTNTVVDGHAVHGRIQYVYYSVLDSTASSVLWPVPNPNSRGATRP